MGSYDLPVLEILPHAWCAPLPPVPASKPCLHDRPAEAARAAVAVEPQPDEIVGQPVELPEQAPAVVEVLVAGAMDGVHSYPAV